MPKSLRNILFIFTLLLPLGNRHLIGQDGLYEIVEFQDTEFITRSLEENIWQIDENWNGHLLKKNSDWVDFPFYGLVKLNSEGQIIAQQVDEVLGLYGPFEATLSSPIPVLIPGSNSNETSYIIDIDVSKLTGSVVGQLPISPDSIRLRVVANYSDSAFRESKILKSGNEITSKYYTRELNISKLIEVKIGPFEWESVEDIAPMIDWSEDYTTNQFILFSDSNKFPTMIIEQNNGTSSIAYLKDDALNVESRNTGIPDIRAIPNPAINDLRFQLENLNPGTYTLKIKNILGVLLETRIIDFNRDTSVNMEVSNFRKGSYFYSLEDSDGNIISTKRLIILRP